MAIHSNYACECEWLYWECGNVCVSECVCLYFPVVDILFVISRSQFSGQTWSLWKPEWQIMAYLDTDGLLTLGIFSRER